LTPRAALACVFATATLATLLIGNVSPLLAEGLRMRAMAAVATSDAGLETARAYMATAARLAPWEPNYPLEIAKLDAGWGVSLGQAVPPDSPGAEAAFGRSEVHLRRALRMNPDDFQLYYTLGQLFELWAAIAPARREDARRVYAEVAARCPRRQRTYWLWGDLLLTEGDASGAEAMYQRALALDPRVAASHGALAMLYERMGRPEDAERARRSARALRPSALVIVPHAPLGSGQTSTPIP
jgi:hypothetical protein